MQQDVMHRAALEEIEKLEQLNAILQAENERLVRPRTNWLALYMGVVAAAGWTLVCGLIVALWMVTNG